MLKPNIIRLKSRLDFLMRKNYSISDLSRILGVNRAQLYKLTKASKSGPNPGVSTRTIEKVIMGFFRAFKPYVQGMTDKELCSLITTELFSNISPSKLFPTVREKNRIDKEKTFQFKTFPGFDTNSEN